MAGGDLGLGSLEVATSVLLCPYKVPLSFWHPCVLIRQLEGVHSLIRSAFMCPALCDLHRYSSENTLPVLKELRVWWARWGNKIEQYGPSVHPFNTFTEYLLCSKNYSSAGDLVVRKTDKNNCRRGAYHPARERETIRK